MNNVALSGAMSAPRIAVYFLGDTTIYALLGLVATRELAARRALAP